MPRSSNRAREDTSRQSPAAPERETPGTSHGTVYTMAEAAALKGVLYHTVSRAVRSNKLPARRLGRMALISAEDLRDWRPMRERAPHKYRRRAPNPDASPALVDLSVKDRVTLALELSTLYELLHQAAVELPLPAYMSLVADRFAGALGLKRVVIWAVETDRQLGRRLASFGPPVSNYPATAPLADLSFLRVGLELDQSTVFSRPALDQTSTPWEVHHLGPYLWRRSGSAAASEGCSWGIGMARS